MTQQLDQLFVSLKQWIIGLLPGAAQPLVAILLSIAGIIGVFATMFAITTIMERKILGRIQNRYGPNRTGPFGLLQPAADGVKMLTKEDIVPFGADKIVHFLAPVVLMIPVALALAVIPYGRNMTAVDLDAGILFFFAVGSATELSVFMAGWSSQNKYSLVGAMRAIAQMISYELPLVLSTVSVLMMVGTLSLPLIVEAQSGYIYNFIPRWHVFTPWGFAGFILFMIAATAESNRSPFDLPEAESEIIAGYLTEYSGFKYALFFMAEYWGLFAVSGLAVTLFLGGWNAPLPMLEFIPSWAWFFVKLSALIVGFIWIRGTLPRLRLDQLMNFAWKFLLPLALINIFVAAIWHFSRSMQFSGALEVRWLMCATVIVIPYVVLGRALGEKKPVKRQYTFANN
jgi:NADH-quinone oxidoreductase subunit H